MINSILEKILSESSSRKIPLPRRKDPKKCKIMLVVDSNDRSLPSSLPSGLSRSGYSVSIDRPHSPHQLPFAYGGANQKGGYIRAGSPQSYLTCANNPQITENNNINVRGDVSNPSEILGHDSLASTIQGKF